ncbi:MAG: DUF1592 domain-containing protein [Myxococcota bacterium]
MSLPGAFGPTGLRRLTQAELSSSLLALYGQDASDLLVNLPAEGSTQIPFDDDTAAQSVSTSLIEALSTFAEAYAARVAAAPAPIYALAGCQPQTPTDRPCFEAIARALGRRAFRRPLTTAEVQGFAGFLAFANEEQRFLSAVEMLIAALIQHPEHLYRLEPGPDLDAFAVGTRLSFLITGSAPDEPLLAAAEAGMLADPSARRAQAQRLLATPLAAQQWARFHGQWLGYQDLSIPGAISADLRSETEHLVARLLSDPTASWLSLFTSEDTYLTPALAEHYGLPRPAQPSWVRYPAERGGGILSQGALLALGSKFGDTSPTLRGVKIFDRVLCGTLGSPPPDVDTDNPPPGPAGACKPDLYYMRRDPGCQGCHARTDNIGFGLENFSATGQWRTTEVGRPNCVIDGRGRVLEQDFVGPRQLGAILAAAPEVGRCATTQLFRYLVGRPENSADAGTLAALYAQLQLTPRLPDLLLKLVESPGLRASTIPIVSRSQAS